MNIFGLKVVGPNGNVVLDPDSFTVRMVEAKIHLGGKGTWVTWDPVGRPRYYNVAMSSAVKAGMFAIVSPMGEIAANRNLRTNNFGGGMVTDPMEAGLPVAQVVDGGVILDAGPIEGYCNLDVAIYVLAYN